MTSLPAPKREANEFQAAIPQWSPEAAAVIEGVSSAVEYPPQATLIEQESFVETVYVLERGMLKLLRWEADDRSVLVGLRFSGWLLGAASAILKRPSPVSAETMTKCRVRPIRRRQFVAALKECADLSWQLHKLHSRELYEQVGQIAVGALSARRRLERILGEFCRKEPRTERAVRLRMPLKHCEIAQTIMVTPEYLSRLLGQLEEERLIRRSKGWLIIPEPQKLDCEGAVGLSDSF